MVRGATDRAVVASSNIQVASNHSEKNVVPKKPTVPVHEVRAAPRQTQEETKKKMLGATSTAFLPLTVTTGTALTVTPEATSSRKRLRRKLQRKKLRNLHVPWPTVIAAGP